MHCQKAVILKKCYSRIQCRIKYALTNAAYIYHCWQNGRDFYKTHLATLTTGKLNVKTGSTLVDILIFSIFRLLLFLRFSGCFRFFQLV